MKSKILGVLLLFLAISITAQQQKLYINSIPVYQTVGTTNTVYQLFKSTGNPIQLTYLNSSTKYDDHYEPIMSFIDTLVGSCNGYPNGICVVNISGSELEINGVPVFVVNDPDNNQKHYTLYELNPNADKITILDSVLNQDRWKTLMLAGSDDAGACDDFYEGICVKVAQ